MLRKRDENLTNWPKYPHFFPSLGGFSGKGGPAGQVTRDHGPGNFSRKPLWKTYCNSFSRSTEPIGTLSHSRSDFGLIIHRELISAVNIKFRYFPLTRFWSGRYIECNEIGDTISTPAHFATATLTMTDLNSIKAKISKLLRLQQSDNAGEAANAAAFVERLCREHGLTPDDINPDHDPERDEPTFWVAGASFKRVDHADWSLLNHVAKHYNGQTIQRCARAGEEGYLQDKSVIEVVATKGNRIQIELYYAYLKEVMERLADEAKAKSIAEGYSSRSFRLNFRKGFAQAIGEKLREQKKVSRDEQPHAQGETAGLALLKRDAIERKAVDALVKHRFPRLRSGSASSFGGNGTNAGRAAGRSTSVNRQVTRTSTPQLMGR